MKSKTKPTFVPLPGRGGPCLGPCEEIGCKDPVRCSRLRQIAGSTCPICGGPIGYGVDYRRAPSGTFQKRTLNETIHVHRKCWAHRLAHEDAISRKERRITAMTSDAKRFFFARALVHVSQVANVSTDQILHVSHVQRFTVWWLFNLSNGSFDENDLALVFPTSERLSKKEDVRRIKVVIRSVENAMNNPANNQHRYFWELFTELLLHPDQGSQVFDPPPPQPEKNRKEIGRKRNKQRSKRQPDGSGVHAF